MEGNHRKERIGTVTSSRMEKITTVVSCFKEKHPIYGGFASGTKKYYTHDEKNEMDVGDRARVMETYPLSRTKRWRLTEIIEKTR